MASTRHPDAGTTCGSTASQAKLSHYLTGPSTSSTSSGSRQPVVSRGRGQPHEFRLVNTLAFRRRPVVLRQATARYVGRDRAAAGDPFVHGVPHRRDEEDRAPNARAGQTRVLRLDPRPPVSSGAGRVRRRICRRISDLAAECAVLERQFDGRRRDGRRAAARTRSARRVTVDFGNSEIRR